MVSQAVRTVQLDACRVVVRVFSAYLVNVYGHERSLTACVRFLVDYGRCGEADDFGISAPDSYC